MSNSTAPWMIPTQQSGAVKADSYLNINEASQACGLSPSVLRIWELRYGWPNPRRKANGYRSYSPHLVEDLKRIAKLIEEGAHPPAYRRRFAPMAARRRCSTAAAARPRSYPHLAI